MLNQVISLLPKLNNDYCWPNRDYLSYYFG